MRITLTVVSEVLREEAIKKKEAWEEENKALGDRRIDYESLGLPEPEDAYFEYDDEDYKEVDGEALVLVDEIDLVISFIKPEEGSTVFLKSGKEFNVKETVKVIKELISNKKRISLKQKVKRWLIKQLNK